MSVIYHPIRNSEKAAHEVLMAAAAKAVLDKHDEKEMMIDKQLSSELEEEMNALLPDIARAVVLYDDDTGKATPMIVTNSFDKLAEKMRAAGLWLVDNFRWSIENEGWK